MQFIFSRVRVGCDENIFNEAINKLVKTYAQYPPRKLQSETYASPITLSRYHRFKWVREQSEKEGVNLPLL
jgi:hypothetical protein